MLPFKTLLHLDKTLPQPIFAQLSEQLGQLIRVGTLTAGQRLPGTRQLADLLNLHRQTVVAAYDDLLAQGWLESRAGSGTYVATHLPDMKPQSISAGETNHTHDNRQTGFSFIRSPELVRAVMASPSGLRLDDGLPDARLAPLDELGRAYRSYFRWGSVQAHVGYGDTKGHPLLREELSRHLNETRGLRTTPDNVLITRGSIMGLFLTCQVVLRPGRGTAGEVVVTGETTWAGATMNLRRAGATLRTVPVDAHGLDVDALGQLCEQQQQDNQPVRMVYVTPHHHYPTTVTLRADRRVRLLQLAEQYGFAVLEDDYDYDYHYLGRPILPLASADRRGMVVYVGSLTKSVAPAFRVGYVVAPTELIDELARFRRIIDRQGDAVLEYAIGQLFHTGEMKRHFRKSLRAYHARRDHLCALLASELPDAVQFQKPDGGMAVWATFDRSIDVAELSVRAERAGLAISPGLTHNPPGSLLNSTRLGFASSTEEELERAVEVLRSLL
ncbi:MAG: PLP-dependent aminotransferase family protein [Cytophagales bacterium]|nr:MAG: PLP-dependent aminotransferase family protein [Cytophagales bacterium]